MDQQMEVTEVLMEVRESLDVGHHGLAPEDVVDHHGPDDSGQHADADEDTHSPPTTSLR